MSKLYLYEPAMCCETGLCGVGVDAELLRISTVASNLKNHNITIERYNRTNSPNEFVTNSSITTILREEGVASLPITILDNHVMKKGAYPTNEELSSWLMVPKNLLGAQQQSVMEASKGCGCGSNGDASNG